MTANADERPTDFHPAPTFPTICMERVPAPSFTGAGTASGFTRGPLAVLSPAVQQLLRSVMSSIELGAGEMIFEQGAVADRLFVVERGVASVFVAGSDGTRFELGDSCSGDVLGEMALISGGRRAASAVAATEVRLLMLPADEFERLCRRMPIVAQVLTNVMADRLGSRRHDALSSKSLHGYEIEHLLGRGGMSVVYSAVRRSRGDRVALKMMSHRLIFDPVFRDQFDQEAEVISALRHPNIPRVYDRFSALRTQFIVLELIDGETLDRCIPAGRGLPEDVTLRILGQVAGALSHAHRAGIVHRDLKPSNVMLDRHGAAKLLDFGLAVPPSEDDELIPVGGTISYMPPEQFEAVRVGPEADFFALGCIAYEMLTGNRLFTERTVSGALERRRADEIASFRDAVPWVSETAAAVFESSLRHSPRQRKLDLDALADFAGPVEASDFRCADK